MKEEVSFTDGRIFVKGRKTKRGIRKRADIILYYKANIPVAVIEAKDNNHAAGAGMQQALEYAEMLDIPVAVASNGDGFVIQYRNNCGQIGNNGKPIVTENADLDYFPTPDELWDNYKKYNKLETEKASETSLCPYFFDAAGRTPRYYQRIAINRTVEAIARGENRLLLVMATGTGKTYTAFQIIYRLWKSKIKKRILYLADRNNLIMQTKKGDFKHFKDKCHIIKQKKIDTSYEIYLALYQGLTNYDGFLAPYKVLRVGMNVDSCGEFHTPALCAVIKGMKADCNHLIRTTPPMLCVRSVDLEGYRPERGKTDVNDEIIEDRLYICRNRYREY